MDVIALDPAQTKLFISAFVTFFVVIDVIGVAPMFSSLTASGGRGFKASVAAKSVIYAAAVLLGFAYFGEWLFTQLHISLEAFRIAGGVLLFLLALDMLFERRTMRREERLEAVRDDADLGRDGPVAVFPMAIPFLAGPSAIASAILFMAEQETVTHGATLVVIAMIANLLICFFMFLGAGLIMRQFGVSGAAMITRILGVVLAALAAQFIIDGIKGAFALGV